MAVRLIVEREREIQAFVPIEYWSLHARLRAEQPPEFDGDPARGRGEKANLPSEADDARGDDLAPRRGAGGSKSVTRGERRRNPAAPFITSTLQQDAGRKLGFTAKKTMTLAQQLYEGVELGAEGAVGLITYMRTDSVRVAQEAQAEARAWVTRRLGDAVPARRAAGVPGAQAAQEAHEAIRPSDGGPGAPRPRRAS